MKIAWDIVTILSNLVPCDWHLTLEYTSNKHLTGGAPRAMWKLNLLTSIASATTVYQITITNHTSKSLSLERIEIIPAISNDKIEKKSN